MRIAGWLVLLLQLLAPAQPVRADQATAALTAADARHLLARTGFGPTREEVQQYTGLSRAAAVERLLAPLAGRGGVPVTEPPAWVDEPILPFRSFRDAPASERAAYVRLTNRQTLELRGWWLREMFATPQPLLERMTLFWHGHFTSSQQKVRYPQLMYRQNMLLRGQALGNFRSLLHAVARDPAMIIYLDTATNRRGRPNENFAREVMELFTLGEGNYGEADIREAARAFTGWSLDADTARFVQRPFVHDNGEKTVLGRSGNFDGDAVLDILLEQPRAAEYLVGRLWREFVSAEADPVELQRIAAAFRASDYDIRTALRELFLSEAFWASGNRGALVKSPVEYVVGALRQFDLRPDNMEPLALVSAGLGQNLFAPPNVKGWPGAEAWINASTLLARKQFVERLFRTEEMLAPGQGEAMPGRATPAAVRRGPPLPAFSRQWLKAWSDERDPAIEQLVLAAPPAHPVAPEARGREWLRQLALDPAYQLK